MEYQSQSKNPQQKKVVPHRLPKLDEEEILDRLQRLQDAVELPSDVWTVVLELLCPDEMTEPPLAPKPTDTLPGTEARLKVMAERVDAGYQPFHPDDATFEDDANDRLGIAGCRLRNGALARMGQPLVVQRHDGFHPAEVVTAQPQVATPSLLEGFLLPAECTVVVGRLPAPPRRRRKPKPVAATARTCCRQRLIWEASD